MKWIFAFLLAFCGLGTALARSPIMYYPDNSQPESTPTIFAPGLVSTAEHEFACCFSPDGTEFYFTRAVGPYKKKSIWMMRYANQQWSEPQSALPSFDGETYEPHITTDGKHLFFMGMTFVDGESAPLMDLFCAERQAEQWTGITHLDQPFNPRNCMFVSTTSTGRLYTTNRSGSGPDIVYCDWEQGQYGNYQDPGPTVNTEASELYPFVAYDGSYLLFNRITEQGKRLFVCFRQTDGQWGESVQVPLGMESGCPMVSPDNQALFFAAGKRFAQNIYWVDAAIFLSLQP